MSISPASMEALQSLFLGFALAGLFSSAFEYFTQNRASFKLLQLGGVRALICVPFIVFSAPFIIMRNTIRGRRIEGRKFAFAFTATVIAGFWAIASGRIALDFAHALVG
jgi:hypothetical protein